MAWLGEPVEIGLFAATSVLIGGVMLIPNSISTALQPRVGPDANGRPELVAAASRLSFATVGAGLAVLLATSGIVVPLLLSEAFAGAVPLLWLMAPGQWVKSATKPMTSFFIGVNRPGLVSLATGVELVASLVLMPLLYRRAGLAGAAAAATAAYTLSSLVLVVAFRTVSGMGLCQTWRLRRADLLRFLGLGRRFWPKGRPDRA
jgi:O-antigen/teichoic acid export membrane protein